MNAIFTVLAILVILAAVLLTAVVLLQNGKGGGLASNFVAGNATFGVRQTADILEKITWGLAAFILLLSVVSNFTQNTGKSGIDVTEDIQNAVVEEAPAFPSAPVQENPEE
ncbi:MAG: preprotein translocase subunit SecG [Bacteroidales bacterium]|nr:preprotein translocase subunit SecG [Bacteroidales bacterium]